MESILYVGMDVHTTNYTLCTYSIEEDKEFGLVKFEPDYLNIVRYVRRLKEHHGEDILILLERFFFIDSEFFAICLVKFSMKSLTYCLLHGTIIVEISHDNLANFSMEV